MKHGLSWRPWYRSANRGSRKERDNESLPVSLANSQEVWPPKIRRSRKVLLNRINFPISNRLSSYSYESYDTIHV